jgi:hypothetical protein
MGFFQKLFGLKPSNPTESFPRRLVPPSLIWDTTSRTLTGIPLPSPVEALVPLGPSDAFRFLSPNFGVLSYHALGLEIEVSQGKVQHFSLVISEGSGNPAGPFVHSRPLFAPAGKVIEPETTIDQLTALLGPGEKNFEDEDEAIHLFLSGHVAIEAAYHPGGKLIRLEIYNNHE